jgi:hypothetical protein
MPGPKSMMQEKFQVTARNERKENNSWASFESTRRVSRAPVETYSGKHTTIRDLHLNEMPCGHDITQQNLTEQNPMRLSMAGETDETNAVNTANVRKGWIKRDFSPVEDMYTNEHVEEFYGEATGEDDGGDKVTGFLERNNYLDRN